MRKSLLIWGGLVILFLLLVGQVNNFGTNGKVQAVPYSTFLSEVDKGEVKSANLDMQNMKVTFVNQSGTQFMSYNPEAMDTRSLIGELKKNDVVITSEPVKKESLLTKIFINLLPILLLIGLFIFVSRQMQGGGKGGALSFGKNKARLIPEDKIKITFADVAGADEAKEEVQEVVDFLKDPTKFSKLGGQIPRGILMVGPPGTGKTLIAKAVAGEAKVPFYTISGSDFVEMFVGVGASRVRTMFEEAKKNAPCIIFIDEIDAVGRKRGSGMGGGHDEREQTLNQMLVEMDGFDGNEGVIVIAATNRADVLDPALLRPGRFDRQVNIGLPDLRGREQILKVHMRKKPIASLVSARDIARGTPGFSGADLANLVNEAALFAARKDRKEIMMQDMENAKDKIMMGPERKSAIMSKAELEMTAYHESGHCIVGRSVPSHDPVYKVTIIPRGRALGVTMFLPERDKYSQSKEALESSIATLYGGRLAEELIYGKDKVSTGASNDIKVATNYARDMVTKWGLSEQLGPLLYEDDGQEMYLGQGGSQQQSISNETALLIDQEKRSIIDRNYQRAKAILTENMDILHAMAAALLKYETIDEAQIDDLMNRKAVRAPADWEEDSKTSHSTADSDDADPTESEPPTDQEKKADSEEEAGSEENQSKE